MAEHALIGSDWSYSSILNKESRFHRNLVKGEIISGLGQEKARSTNFTPGLSYHRDLDQFQCRQSAKFSRMQDVVEHKLL